MKKLFWLYENLMVLTSGTTTSYQTNCAQPVSSNFLTLASNLFKQIFNSYLLRPSCFKYCLNKLFLYVFSFYLFCTSSRYTPFSSMVVSFNDRIYFTYFSKLRRRLQGSLFFSPSWHLVNSSKSCCIPPWMCDNCLIKSSRKVSSMLYILREEWGICSFFGVSYQLLSSFYRKESCMAGAIILLGNHIVRMRCQIVQYNKCRQSSIILQYSMRKSKQVKVQAPPDQPPPQPSPKIKPTHITNSYIEQLKSIFTCSQNILTHMDTLINIFHKTNQHFLIDLSTKMSVEDYKMFVAHLVMFCKDMDEHVVEKSKRSPWQYILVEGCVSYNIKSDAEEEQMMQVGVGQAGFVVFPEIFMSPRYANYTIKCQTDCTFLALNEDVYNRYIKKLMVKQVDKLADFINDVSIFDGMGTLNVRKYLAYFIPKSYKFNQIIYTSGSEASQIYFVVKGEVQIYSTKGQNQINVVSLGQGECFGLDGEGENTNLRTFNAKSKNANLILLVLNGNILRMMKSENNNIIDNCQNYLKGVEKFHASLIHKNIKVLSNKQQPCRKIARKKKKKIKSNQNSLAWWGLAENVKIQHKYQMPTPPQVRTGRRQINQEEEECKTTLMSHKINQLRRRILQNQENQAQNEVQNQQNEESSPYQVKGNYIPKVKTRVKMLQARPKVIDLAQVVKRKLITYAKNMGSFCDRLNLQ